MAKVHCSRPGGVELTLFKLVDVGLGVKEAQATGESFLVVQGDSDVPDEFLKKWFAMFKDEAKGDEILAAHMITRHDHGGQDKKPSRS